MHQLYLKTNNEEELIKALPFARAIDSESNERWLKATHDYSLDIVGTIYNDDAELNKDGEVIKPATPIDGFHANLKCKVELINSIPKEIIISPPDNPKRTWS